jgi:hypothetical protein
VKMRRGVVGKVHLDDDAVEATEFRHQVMRSRPGIPRRMSCPST